MGSYLECVGFG